MHQLGKYCQNYLDRNLKNSNDFKKTVQDVFQKQGNKKPKIIYKNTHE